MVPFQTEKLNPEDKNLLLKFYDQLFSTFGPQFWWPGETPWEVATGAVLTQNTNWLNVEKAIINLKANGALSAEAATNLPDEQLSKLIRPAGYHNLKAKRLKNLATWWLANAKKAFKPLKDISKLRKSLLAVNGVGEETADSIILYAFGHPSFVVDAYTQRFMFRHKLIHANTDYHSTKLKFENRIPHDVLIFQEYHALIVKLGKIYCRTKPLCEKCPLNWHLIASDEC